MDRAEGRDDSPTDDTDSHRFSVFYRTRKKCEMDEKSGRKIWKCQKFFVTLQRINQVVILDCNPLLAALTKP